MGFIARECLLARHDTSKKGLMSSNPGIMSHTRKMFRTHGAMHRGAPGHRQCRHRSRGLSPSAEKGAVRLSAGSARDGVCPRIVTLCTLAQSFLLPLALKPPALSFFWDAFPRRTVAFKSQEWTRLILYSCIIFACAVWEKGAPRTWIRNV